MSEQLFDKPNSDTPSNPLGIPINTISRKSPATRATGTQPSGWLNAVARKLVIKQLHKLQHGEIVLVDKQQQTQHRFGKRSQQFPVTAFIHVQQAHFYQELAFGGSIAAAESYMLGHWTTDSLTDVVRIMVRNMEVMDAMESGLARLATPVRKALHWLNRNTKQGSRKNIAAHYDIGNDLFALMLDNTMMYSCGIFTDQATTLEQASINKLQRICDKLQLSEQDHVVEIGTGWGGFAIYAAQHYGCRVTTTTISKQQYNLALQRIHNLGLQDKITVLLQDYRDLQGQYDKLVSIEMIEAVGHEYYDTFFNKCAELLKPDGMMLLQAITIADQRYEQAKGSVDFIQRYIFPGSCIPSNTAILNSVCNATDMRLLHHEDIGAHYATTLRKWRENFFDNIESVKSLGYNEVFIRLWEFYLCYCEGGFEERAISDVHMVFSKPQCRVEPVLGTFSK
ncbi:MAG: cyclopropane-fatty-acyl-phospholipid synthase family protein [Gammaproteobacteria bacterium]|jgi:cyclopropane-fatty-acyl-phospholipid synthase|nr:cyclopropane-fatty-acyl-phospholipid synthase family protein [Gammaproteobacteria bacterium]